jgi:hypothetical protein
MAFNGVRKLSSVVEVGQLAQKLKRNTHKYMMVFTLRSVFGLFHRLHRTYWFGQHQTVQYKGILKMEAVHYFKLQTVEASKR